MACQRGRDHAVHRGGADLIALVPGAVDQNLQRARGLAAGDAERRDDLRLRQPEQFCRRGRGAIGAGGGGGVKTAGIMRGGIERVAEPAARPATMAVSTSRPEAPTISPTAKAAGTTGALACSEESAWVSSKSKEWPSAPFRSAATAGVHVLVSPNTVASPLVS